MVSAGQWRADDRMTRRDCRLCRGLLVTDGLSNRWRDDAVDELHEHLRILEELLLEGGVSVRINESFRLLRVLFEIRTIFIHLALTIGQANQRIDDVIDGLNIVDTEVASVRLESLMIS